MALDQLLGSVECPDCAALQGEPCISLMQGLYHEGRHRYAAMSPAERKDYRKRMLRIQARSRAQDWKDPNEHFELLDRSRPPAPVKPSGP